MNFLFTPRPGPQVWLWVLGATILFGALLAFLHTLPGRQKKLLIVVSTFLAGLFYFLEFMIPTTVGGGPEGNFLSGGVEPLADFVLVIGMMALGLGIINLARVQGRILLRMRAGWQNAFIFFVGLIGMTVIGIMHDVYPAETSVWTPLYNFFFTGLYTPLASTTFALLAFFIASAAFRAFRITSVESTLMMITAFIVMLGTVGSEVVTGWIPETSPFAILKLDNITLWIMTTVNMSAQRALLFGIAMGELAIALRVWLSLERGHFFEQEV
ncbi:MAG: hypothetical protein KY468_03440 [Armatimonadetes bacterium]|nr:hypothetical protein [Armatimonadota bacterium]